LYFFLSRIVFPFNSGTASVVGNLSVSRRYIDTGLNSVQYGFAIGGYNLSGTVLSIIERIQFPFDTGTASNVGNLTQERGMGAGIDNTDFISQFV